MLKSVIICTAITTFAIIAQAHAQAPYPSPSIGEMYGAGIIQGNRDYNDWQQTRRDHGLDYDQDALGHRNPYNPVPSVTESYGSDPYRSRSPYSSPYGNDD
jgi:hypothetical protein